jgi:hypothetical protein
VSLINFKEDHCESSVYQGMDYPFHSFVLLYTGEYKHVSRSLPFRTGLNKLQFMDILGRERGTYLDRRMT